MNCPKCKGPITTTDTVNTHANDIYKQKKCYKCGHVFYTVETEVEATDNFLEEWHFYHRVRPANVNRT